MTAPNWKTSVRRVTAQSSSREPKGDDELSRTRAQPDASKRRTMQLLKRVPSMQGVTWLQCQVPEMTQQARCEVKTPHVLQCAASWLVAPLCAVVPSAPVSGSLGGNERVETR